MSLSKIITATVLIIPLVMIIATCALSIVFIRDTIDKMLIENSLQAVQIIADASRQAFISGNFETIPKTTQSITALTYIKKNGQVAAYHGHRLVNKTSNEPTIVSKTLQNITAAAPVTINVSPTTGHQSVTMGYIIAEFRVDYEYQIIKTVIFILVMVSIGIYLVTMPLAILLSRKNTQALKQIVNNINRVSQKTSGNKIKYLSESSHIYEIQAIQNAFNHFVKQINSYRHINKTLTDNLKQEAKKSILDKNKILAAYSHEMRIPLHAIRTHAHLLKADLPFIEQPPLQQQFETQIAQILHAESSILHRVDSILSVCKKEDIHITPETLVINDWLNHFTALVKSMVEQSGNTLKVTLLPNHELIKTDKKILEQILIVIIDNACKYTQDGYIHISARRLDHMMVCFDVKDTGIGIHKDDFERIFNPFMRLDAIDGKLRDGLGIGLYLASRLTQAVGGQISLKSRIGIGSRFRVKIPDYVQKTAYDNTSLTDHREARIG